MRDKKSDMKKIILKGAGKQWMMGCDTMDNG